MLIRNGKSPRVLYTEPLVFLLNLFYQGFSSRLLSTRQQLGEFELHQLQELYKHFRKLLDDPAIFEERDVYRDGILKEFDNHKLPQSFREYVENCIYTKNAPASWMKTYFGGAEPTGESRTAYIGSLVKDAHNDAQAYISNHVSRL